MKLSYATNILENRLAVPLRLNHLTPDVFLQGICPRKMTVYIHTKILQKRLQWFYMNQPQTKVNKISINKEINKRMVV